MKKIFLIYCLFVGSLLHSQELIVKVDKNPAVVGEQVLFQYIINQKANNFKSPNFQGLRIISGPNPSTQSSYSFINGKSTSNTTTTYSFYVIAQKEGEYNITPASISVKGNLIESKSFVLKVIKNSTNKIDSKINPKNNLFIEAQVSKKNIVVGEQILVNYKLYVRNVDLYNTEVYSLPDLNGFWQKDLENSTRFKREIINGLAYNVANVKKSVLTAQKSGQLIIDPIELKCSIRIQQSRNSRDPFANFFGNSYNLKEQFISSKALKINVSELTNTPKEFSGIVGDLSISSNVDNNSVAANNAINYSLTIKGKGNLDLINPPKINFPDDFEVYEPKINKKIFKGGLEKSFKTFEYLLIPRIKGQYNIPSTSIIFYNINSNSYKTIRSNNHKISVLENENEDNEIYISNPQEIVVNKDDIFHIYNNTLLIKKENKIIKLRIFYLLIILPILIIIVIYFYDKFYNNSNLNRKKANKIALKRMKKAQLCIDNNDFDNFFEEVEKSLWGYFSDKFKVKSGDLSKETLSLYFKSSGISQEIENTFIALLDECEFARYSQASNRDIQMELLLNKAKNIIIKVESELK